MAFCVVVHAAGLAWALRWLGPRARRARRFSQWTWLFIQLAVWVVILHTIEIGAWGAFLAWKQALPDLHSAIYFSATTYTTTGYGDVVLPRDWHWVSGIEALTGILMCGWSTGFFFAFVSRMVTVETR